MDCIANKLRLALANATNEVTVAAADVNFEFTLVKIEVPPDFQPLGRHLTRKRKQDAETGKIHITARRLGSLFEGVCPATPHLEKAYGSRVSQIADKTSVSQIADHTKSVFGAFSGVDATSIWAAVTASKAALHVHLLACMLARVFEPPQAISVWVELVEERRRAIVAKLEAGEPVPFALAAAAAQQEVQRTQLAEWDASARAWLQTADAVKEWHETQMRLVLKNINLSVGEGDTLFSNVTVAWHAALGTMEKLISGMPQAVNEGAALLGLSAWHIYPDIIFFGNKTTEIQMRDELIAKGGILSLGLTISPDTSPAGVWWSLSLAHLRHYGRPVRSQVRLGTDASRLSFFHLQIVLLGVILGQWRIRVEDTASSLKLLRSLVKKMEPTSKDLQTHSWIITLFHTCASYFKEIGVENELLLKLLNLGRRRCESFMVSGQGSPGPFFGLTNIHTLLPALRGKEERIIFLRHLVETRAELQDSVAIIRYFFRKIAAAETPRLNSIGYLP